MKKTLLIISLCVLLLGLVGCGNDKVKPVSNYSNYESRYKDNYDCPLDDIYDVKNGYIIRNDYKIVYISDKKNTETENHCKYVYKNEKNYKYLGSMDTYSDGIYFLYIDNNNNVIGIDAKGNISNNYKKYEDVDKLYKSKKIKYFYFYERSISPTLEYYFNDNTIHYYISSGYNYDVSIPEGETIIYHGFHEKKKDNYNYVPASETYPLMIITDKGKYNVGVSDDDKCHEYDDVKCTYKLIETKLYDYVFKNYNIKFFDGERLITNGGSYYVLKDFR